MPRRLGVAGAGGRLGRVIVEFAAAAGDRVTLRAGRTWDEESVPEVLIDASHHDNFLRVLDYCESRHIPIVAAVSSLTAAHLDRLRLASRTIAVVHAPNLAFAHHLQRIALGALATYLGNRGERLECTIAERHPTPKMDRPSATARALEELWNGVSHTRISEVSAIRGGLPVSDHEITLTLNGEALTIRHSVTDRAAAAHGALLAARWVAGRPAGWNDMAGVYSSGTEFDK
jgi:4-hydroxy-tetrahydrodipicolinate reductase